jgi:CRISPR-associated protein (TIGR02710 family)
MNPNPSIRAVLVSVGGAPAPVLHVLRHYRPGHVWYFCSAGSRANADAIQTELDWRPQARFIEVDRFEELGPCYGELRRKLPEVLAETKVPAAEVLVDYTGGTKTMSAALVLAAVELCHQFSYVGGEQREKGGLGVTVDGKERVLYQTNPWSDLAVRDVGRAADLWAGCQFDAASAVLRDVAQRAPRPLLFEAVAEVAQAVGARHRLDYPQACKLLNPLLGRIPPLFDGRQDHGLLGFVGSARDLCEACSKGTASEIFLRELLDNALRTAAQGRYEDAAARLYRAMEMQGQLWLAAASRGLFVHGKCKAQDAPELPEALAPLLTSLPKDPNADRDGVKLSLEQVFRALAALGDARAQRIVADLDAQDAVGKTKSRWRAATEKRNASILAHGVKAIGKDGFAQMTQIASEFLGFDLAHQTNPIPPLDPQWF